MCYRISVKGGKLLANLLGSLPKSISRKLFDNEPCARLVTS